MKNPFEKNRRGSALLIVLGFLSFMVVSAVAFSIYMRSERQPSSALRKATSDRWLVKAALARAISKVDDAIRDDPFPGVYASSGDKLSHRDEADRYYDRWLGRVFMPPESCENGVEPRKNDDDKYRLAPLADTTRSDAEDFSTTAQDDLANVLTFEALGYLPPALANDVRFLSRVSWSAKWDYFNFDAGRYAYCAVNVSDFFDLNQSCSTNVRTSATPVSLAYLFASGNSFEPGGGASSFQTRLTTAKSAGGMQNYPFTSLLDYNLAMDATYSPFKNYVGQGSRALYDGMDTDVLANHFFVTDSVADDTVSRSVANKTNTTIFLTYQEESANGGGKYYGQPYTGATMKRGLDNTAIQLINANTPFMRRMASGSDGYNKRFCPVDSVTLFDYLDRDDVPVSLALPCVERVPMVAALAPDVQLKINIKAGEPQKTVSDTAGQRVTTEITEYSLDSGFLGNSPTLYAAIAFPFKRELALAQQFKVQAFMRIAVVENGTSGLGMRQRNDTFSGFRPKKEEWDAAPSPFKLTRTGLSDAFVVSLVSSEETVKPAQVSDADDFESILLGTTGKAQGPDAISMFRSWKKPSLSDTVVYRKKVEKIETKDQDGNVTGSSEKTYFQFVVRPFKADGTLPSTDWVENGGGDFELAYQPYVSVWVRVKLEDDMVDLAPAVAEDDKDYGGNNNQTLDMLGYSGGKQGTPLLRFRAVVANPITFNGSAVDQTSTACEPKSLMTVDPRYNWAPEDWYEKSIGSAQEVAKEWVKTLNGILGSDGREKDPYMFVSNEGYLQSMAELAFLPRVGDFNGNVVLSTMYDGAARTAWDATANANCAWRTYHPYPVDGADADPIFGCGIQDGWSGIRVCPYTDSEKIFMAALANTPYDWWAAGTNTVSGMDENPKDPSEKRQILHSLDDSLDYAFTENTQEAKLTYDELTNIGTSLRNSFREEFVKNGASWQTVFDDLDWQGDDADKFLGVALDEPLHSVDRKFLYGFWRNCFASTQQLFLIFVRAEASNGGGGGRAVALVWRDPGTPSPKTGSAYDRDGNNYRTNERRVPHRTRVLFYHQFD